MSKYKLKAGLRENFSFLKKLHRLTMKMHVEVIWGWDDGQQDRLFLERFDPSKFQIIEFNGNNAGMLSVEDRGSEFF